MGTEIYSRGVFLNRCYEELNLSRPQLVERSHTEFIRAGADVIETNTFAANRPKLEAHGLGGRTREINRAGAQLACKAANGRVFVAGSVGPLGIRLEPWGPTTVDEAVALFREQVQGLVEGGVDLLSLETFSDLVEIQAAVRAVRESGELPVIAMMTVDEEGRTPEGVPPEWIAQKLEATGAELLGVNCSVGPASMLSVIEAMAASTSRPLAAMPNAGIPRTVDGRMLYLTSPAYMGRYARRFVRAGARVVGGCCGVTPEHVRSMREALGEAAGRRVVPRVVVAPPRSPSTAPAPRTVPREQKSRLARQVAHGRFACLVELAPPHGWETAQLLGRAEQLARAGVDGLMVTDDPRAMARMSSLALARLVMERVAAAGPTETVLQYSCRDRALDGMQSDLLGAHALGLRNLMLLTGQAPRPGESSWSSGVFDIDAIGLTNVVTRLNHGLDVGDNPIGDPTAFFSGVLATIAAPDLDEEVRRFEWKVDAGAEFAVTSPVFDLESFERFAGLVAHVRVPIVATIHPLGSLREAEHLAAEVPGVHVPSAILERMAKAEKQGREAEMGLEIARELAEAVHRAVEGLLISGPRALEVEPLAILDGLIGSDVAERRAFPGRPGVKGGAEALRYDDGKAVRDPSS
ncbi:MAG: bifunctional homocysteine S-methyltransferase/methylenetetrahydrofolate reductase [Acidobacteriota bacterium]|nr:MAG: bifunctional homocysteine S-methyltransferase/methylenetetrahydrofolate reductase [Acidobacteriota bacterium]